MASLLLGALGMAALGLMLGLRIPPSVKPGSFYEFAGYASVFIFGVAAVAIVWQWLGASGPIVTLTETGVRDTRLAAEEIPWSAIGNLAIWEYRRQKTLVLSLDPQVEAGLTLTRIARWSRGANKGLGVDGLCIAAAGLAIDFDTLMEEVARRWQASRAQAAGETAATP